ncbi:MAG TPA: adenylate/guanylate cyclase domain-containing protein [Acidobacteriota bacterium]|nr:adenylate/guanylate cyclase domain-containing protein [Acidobacteriota bacterium]HNT18209.1 adenylate/guanylate cyclase domain-containing protein [Acidobacteriota bacterium]
MKTLTEIEAGIVEILKTQWKRRNGQKVPEAEDIKLGNDAVEIEGTVLYADLEDSTGLVLGYKDWFAAEVYKCYLMSACELIKNNGGVITAFDGDRVMAVFIGNTKNSDAAKCALQINYIVQKVINVKLQEHFKSTAFQLNQAVGIDMSNLFIAKTGIRGSNDLVWVGRAANFAAKLCSLREGLFNSYITEEVFNRLMDQVKYGEEPKRLMWDKVMWRQRGIAVYRSSWTWAP